MEITEDVQDWENHVILRVPPDCVERVNRIVNEENPREDMGIMFTSNDMRNAQVRLGHQILSAKLLDLPCINEVFKTLDRKNVYKVADLSQVMICSHEPQQKPPQQPPEPVQPASASASASSVVTSAEQKPVKKEQRQWHYPHGLTAPMKSARRRRFRKTKKKKYMDAPEVEKELKRLLRADLEADSVRWEIVEDKKKDQQQTFSDALLFGDEVSSSESEEEVLVNDDRDD